MELQRLSALVTEAQYAGKSQPDVDKPWKHIVKYSGNCSMPIEITRRSHQSHVQAVLQTRCRKCKGCLEAKRRYWGKLGENEILTTHEQGRRTWFGTLTLSDDQQKYFETLAVEKFMLAHKSSEVPEWLSEPQCDARFALVRDEIVEALQRYWKRLRKEGHRFNYLVVFERHKSGQPHMHFLLHEKGGEILKRQMAEQWPHGFVKIKLVKDNSGVIAGLHKQAWYVVKYLTKSVEARVIASQKYGKQTASRTSEACAKERSDKAEEER